MIRVYTSHADGRIAVEVRQEHPRGTVTVNLPGDQRQAAQVYDALVHELAEAVGRALDSHQEAHQ